MSTTSTKAKDRVCFDGPHPGTAYCGRSSAPVKAMRDATCADCFAAFRADEAAEKARADR